MVKVDGLYFKDDHGRVLTLRGVNLGGSTKLPTTPPAATHIRHKFYDHRAVSFVGRPFPAAEADEHFSRLRQWGFNCLRFLTTWEAIEHAGPGIYDLIYLDYLQKMVAKAGEYGFYVFIDPHQDVWSRWTGGDGAPGWTLEAVGMDLTKLHATGAAFLHQEHGDPCPTMRWPTNYGKLGAATMFTLFFAGQDLAPRTQVDGVSIQEYLQSHYINAIKQVALRVKDMPHVLGYDTLNEPSCGWIGATDLHKPVGLFQQGSSPTPWQAMQAAAGIPVEVDVYSLTLQGVKKTGKELLNPGRERLWREGYGGVWQENGVWMLGANDEPELLRPRHFAEVNGRQIEFNEDYLRPFILRFAAEIRAVHPEAIMFAEGTLEKGLPELRDLPQTVNASHWYDTAVLFLREYQTNLGIDAHSQKPVLGQSNIKASFKQQLGHIKEEGAQLVGGPTLLGEFGIAYDINQRIGFREGNFGPHIGAMNRTWQALEANLLSGTIWNYTADNDNEHGDQWNGEDLSLFSRDQFLPAPLHDPHDLDEGGRATAAFVRPYPYATAGTPLRLSFDPTTRIFEYTFQHDPTLPLGKIATEIFVPDYHYGAGLGVELSDGECVYEPENQRLYYYHTTSQETHTIRLQRQRGEAELLAGTTIQHGDQSYPVTHQFVRTNGVTLHTVQAGPEDGELVILLHGFPEFWYGWREQIPFLVRQGYRVIAPDQRGYNLSDKPQDLAEYHLDKLAADVVGLIDAHGREQAYLIGHDWGAMVTWWAGAKYPSRFPKIAVLNVPHPIVFARTLKENPAQIAKSWYIGLFQISGLPEKVLSANNGDGLAQMLRLSSQHDTFTEQDMAEYRRAWSRPHAVKSMINWYRAFTRQAPKLTDKRLHMPVLVIWGARDVALSREMAWKSVQDFCDDGRVVYLEEATHWVQHDEPERVNGLLARFLAGGTPS